MLGFLNCLKILVWGGSFVLGGNLGGKGRLDRQSQPPAGLCSFHRRQAGREAGGGFSQAEMERLNWDFFLHTPFHSIHNCPPWLGSPAIVLEVANFLELFGIAPFPQNPTLPHRTSKWWALSLSDQGKILADSMAGPLSSPLWSGSFVDQDPKCCFSPFEILGR